MKETLRRIMELKRDKKKTAVCFISDQTPHWNSIHLWVDFLNQETPVFTGTERIARKVGAIIYYAEMKRIKRGYYHSHMRNITDDVTAMAEFEPTKIYMKLLQETIEEAPAFWLWTHNRWKRSKAVFEQRMREKEEQSKKSEV